MARGSSSGQEAEASGGGASGIEMLGTGGSLDAAGKKTLVKKYFVTTQGELETAENITGYTATAISHTKVAAGWEKSVTYEALHSTQIVGQTGFQGSSSDKGTFELISSYEIKNIALHPRISKLKEIYRGVETTPGFITFPEFLPAGQGGLAGARGAPNPMYGITSYKEYTFTLRHTYYKENPSGDIFAKAGFVTTKLPGNFPIPKGEAGSDGKEIKRRWMVQVPSARKEGRGWRIEQDYVLLDAKGFPTEMYIQGN